MGNLSIAGPVPVAGLWNASTNTPTLANGTGTPGQLYRVTVAGTRNLGAGNITFSVGDYVVCNASKVWVRSTSAGRVPETRSNVEAKLNTGITVDTVADRVTVLSAATKVQKSEVDSLDAGYATVSYYQTRDALLVPKAAKGVAGGVATIDAATGKVTASQVPAKGDGTFKGPYGYTTLYTGTAGSTPVKIADWALGPTAVTARPYVYMQAHIIVSNRGRPVIEVRAGDATQTTYASQTLIATGSGRALFDDYQCVTVRPCAPTGVNPSWTRVTTVATEAAMLALTMAQVQVNDVVVRPDGVWTLTTASPSVLSSWARLAWGGGVDLRLTAWLFDSAGGQSAINGNYIGNATAYLVSVYA